VIRKSAKRKTSRDSKFTNDQELC